VDTQAQALDGNPPEIPFAKLQELVRTVAGESKGGVWPIRLDTTWWIAHGYRDLAARSRLRSAALFLDVMGSNHELTVNGQTLVRYLAQEQLKDANEHFRVLFERAFQPILPVALREGVTREELKQAFSAQWHLSNEAADRRALPFFISGAVVLGVSISTSLKTRAAFRAAAQAQRTPFRPEQGSGALRNGHHNGQRGSLGSDQEDTALPSPTAGVVEASAANGAQVKTVTLPGVGDISLAVRVNVFALSEAQRAWLFDLIDRVRNPGSDVLGASPQNEAPYPG
jgi:hypothetical protein